MRRKDITLPYLIESFFIEHLVQQKKVSQHTVSSYRDTFRLLLKFIIQTKKKEVSNIVMEDIDVDCVLSFLKSLESERGSSTRSRNQRLAALKSFFKYANLILPDRANQIQRILVIPRKRMTKRLVDHLTREEAKSLLESPDRTTWVGRRDHLFILFAIETGLRLSEMLSLNRNSLFLESRPYVHCIGKGRKERQTPIGKGVLKHLREWLKESGDEETLFPTHKGTPMSPDAAQHMLKKYKVAAIVRCPSLKNKRVTPHVLRHTTAMNMLYAGIDPAVIALWLGHESMETTLREYVTGNLELKERMLSKMSSQKSPYKRYKPSRSILSFLEKL